jgi:integrase
VARPAERERVFTEEYITGLKPESTRYEVHDHDQPGLRIRVTPSGHKSFCVVYRARGGDIERVTLGPYPALRLKKAREEARAIVGRFAVGKNPAEEKRQMREEATLGELWQKFLNLHAKPRKRSWETDERRWKLHLSSHADERLRSFTTPRVASLLAEVAAASGPGASNRVRALLFTMFEKGRKEWGLTVPNPVRDTARNPEKSRERYLLPEELRAFISAVDSYPDPDTRLWLTLALFTAQRRGALCRMKWADVNLTDAAWSIPAEDMKAGRPLLVPLARHVVDALKARRETFGPQDVYVFPSDRRECFAPAPYEGLKRVLEASGIAACTPHDLRRAWATWAQDAGAPLEVIGRVLGHTPQGGVTSVYARVPLDTLRRWVERTAQNMLRVSSMPTGAAVLHFPGADASAGRE